MRAFTEEEPEGGTARTFHASGVKQFTYRQICDAMRGRQTSKPEDEPLITGPMMLCDMHRILMAESREDRMCAFWATAKFIPSSVVFCTTGRLQKPGYRWAPASLADGGTAFDDLLTDAASAVVSPHGIQFQSQGLILENANSHPLSCSFWVLDDSGEPVWWSFVAPYPASGAFLVPSRDANQHDYIAAALLAADNMVDPSAPPSTFSVLVCIYKNSGGVLYARRGEKATMVRYNPDHDHRKVADFKRPKVRKQIVHKKHLVCEGKIEAVIGHWTDDCQSWCID